MSQNVNCKHHCESYFSVLGDVKESCFGMTTYLIFRWQCENCRLLHNFPLWWLNQLIHLETNIGTMRERDREREREREREYSDNIDMNIHKTTWIGAYNWMWLSLINQLFTEQC